jgi:hypothetical protein
VTTFIPLQEAFGDTQASPVDAELPRAPSACTAPAGTRLPYRRKPCGGCPWRTDAPIGHFPPSAFRRLAGTAYDMARTYFACHESDETQPLVCAGFFLRGAEHNLQVRLDLMDGGVDRTGVHDGGHELYDNYQAMAEANHVDPDDPALAPCRAPREAG